METMSRSDWEQLPEDPNPERDLGYTAVTLSIIRTENGSGQYVILPEDDSELRNDAFIVADEGAVCDVVTRI